MILTRCDRGHRHAYMRVRVAGAGAARGRREHKPWLGRLALYFTSVFRNGSSCMRSTKGGRYGAAVRTNTLALSMGSALDGQEKRYFG